MFPLGSWREADLRTVRESGVNWWRGGGWRRAPQALPILHHHPIIIPQPPSPSHTRHPIISSGEAVPAVGTKSYPIISSPTPTHHPPTCPPLSHMQPVPSPAAPPSGHRRPCQPIILLPLVAGGLQPIILPSTTNPPPSRPAPLPPASSWSRASPAHNTPQSPKAVPAHNTLPVS